MELNIVSLGMSLKNHNHLPLPQIRLQPFECFFFDTGQLQICPDILMLHLSNVVLMLKCSQSYVSL